LSLSAASIRPIKFRTGAISAAFAKVAKMAITLIALTKNKRLVILALLF
jgi:hypothetical protein